MYVQIKRTNYIVIVMTSFYLILYDVGRTKLRMQVWPEYHFLESNKCQKLRIDWDIIDGTLPQYTPKVEIYKFLMFLNIKNRFLTIDLLTNQTFMNVTDCKS